MQERKRFTEDWLAGGASNIAGLLSMTNENCALQKMCKLALTPTDPAVAKLHGPTD